MTDEIESIDKIPCIYDYDINSAYPTTIAELPTLTDGRWLREKESMTDTSRKVTTSQVKQKGGD